MKTAWCSTCKQHLPITEFHKDATEGNPKPKNERKKKK